MSQQEDNTNQQEYSSDQESLYDQEMLKNIKESKSFSIDLELCYQIFDDLKVISELSLVPFLDKLTFDDLFEFLFNKSYQVYSFEEK
jgi:hypothetical protein